MIGNKSDAQMLYNSIHNKCCPDEETDIKSIGGRKVSKGRGKKLFSRIKQ